MEHGHRRTSDKRKNLSFFEAVGTVVALILGCGILYLAIATAVDIEQKPNNFLPILTFCGVGVVLTLLGYQLTKWSRVREQKFFMGMRPIFVIGFWGIGILFGLTMIGAVVSLGSSTKSECTSSIKDTIQSTLASTVPVATDKETGTGFYVTSSGEIVTAYHVINGAKAIYLNFASGKVPLSIVQTAQAYDIALLRPTSPQSNPVTPLRFYSGYTVGDDVIAAGYPGNTFFAGQASVSEGIVSRIITSSDLKLNDDSAPSDLEYVQTDAAVNPGNSGGPLMSTCGVVGVIDAKSDVDGLSRYGLPASESSISYAISAKAVASQFALSVNSKQQQ